MIRKALLVVTLLTAAPATASEAVKVEERREADGTYTLVHEVTVAAAPGDVWRAISTAEGWRGWAAPVARMVAGEADLIETSYDPAAAPGGPATIRQLFLVRIPDRKLVFRTVKGPDGFKHIDSFSKVTSTFELRPAGAGRTRVRLSGAGYPDDEAGRQLVGFFRTGNRLSLEMLRTRFEHGPIDWSQKLGAVTK
jgi:uncharacterized protein YndB with AHSA1/START domain